MAGRDDPEHLEQPEPRPARMRNCFCDKRVSEEFVIEYCKCDDCKAEACQHLVKLFDSNVTEKQVQLCKYCEEQWRKDGKLHEN